MLLKQLLTGRKRSDFVVIKDNINFNGISVLKKFIEEGKNRNIQIHLILSEYDMTNFNLDLNIIVHKYFSDPWKFLMINDDMKNFEYMFDTIINESILTGVPILIVIDSIASILQSVDIHILCNCLKKISTTYIKDGIPVAQVVTILHSELVPDESVEYKFLNYIATSMINVEQESSGTSAITVAYRQPIGKVLTEFYTCSYGPNKEFLYEQRSEPPKPKESNEEILVKSTFKLTLADKEKESRSKVVLPYLKTNNEIGKGRIFYEPDVNDDWDDEDPDDDLEI